MFSYIVGAVAAGLAAASLSVPNKKRIQYCTECGVPRTRDHPCHACDFGNTFTYNHKNPDTHEIPFDLFCPKCIQEKDKRERNN